MKKDVYSLESLLKLVKPWYKRPEGWFSLLAMVAAVVGVIILIGGGIKNAPVEVAEVISEDRNLYVPNTISLEAQQQIEKFMETKPYNRELPSADASLETWREAGQRRRSEYRIPLLEGDSLQTGCERHPALTRADLGLSNGRQGNKRPCRYHCGP